MNDHDKEARADVRFFSGLMFGQLTVFLATSGILLKMFLDSPLLPWIFIALTGLAVAGVFFVINIRSRDWVETSRRRAKESSPPIPKWREKLTATYATYFLYAYVAIAWIILLIISAVQLPRAVSCL